MSLTFLAGNVFLLTQNSVKSKRASNLFETLLLYDKGENYELFCVLIIPQFSNSVKSQNNIYYF